MIIVGSHSQVTGFLCALSCKRTIERRLGAHDRFTEHLKSDRQYKDHSVKFSSAVADFDINLPGLMATR
jgi:hypothetical protein